VDLPQRRALIAQEVFLRNRAAGFLCFGVEFGSTVRTFITSTSIYIVALTILFMNIPWFVAVAAGAAFGLGRSIGPLQSVFAESTWSDGLVAVSRRLERSGRSSSRSSRSPWSSVSSRRSACRAWSRPVRVPRSGPDSQVARRTSTTTAQR
jgi:hypothetical protein